MKKFTLVAAIIMLVILAMSLTACGLFKYGDDSTTPNSEEYKVTIHPNNGDDAFEWKITDPIPNLTYEGYVLEGFYADSNFTSAISLSTLQITGITGNIDVYVKWKKDDSECDHNIVIDAAAPATCTEKGLTEGKHCSKCDEVILAQIEVPALGHTSADAVKENEIAPTCTTAGSYDSVVYCSVCDVEISRETITVDALGHDTERHNAQAPTCTEIGWEAYETCSRCDHSTYVEIPATGHDYEADVIDPTCTEKGYTVYTCHCGDTYVADIIPATGHSPAEAVVENNIDATCTTDGSYDSVVYCSACDVEILRESIIINKLEHKWIWVVDKNATVTETGLKHEECSVCHIKRNENTTIDILDCSHQGGLVHHEQVDATCTEDGTIEYWHCAACDKKYTDAAGQIIAETIVIPTTGHTGDKVKVENYVSATCTTDGSYDSVFYCSVCNEEFKRITKNISAKGHTASAAVVENNVAPTCSTTGSYDNVVYCSVCKTEISRQTITVDALGHALEAHSAKTPTCTEIGWSAYVTCSRCDHTTYAEIPPTGHTESAVVIENNVAPTCSTTGSYDNVVYCSVCDVELSRETITVDALGHDIEEHEAKAPTCVEFGWEAYVTCSRCDHTTYAEIPPTGHSYNVVVTSPTCTTGGYTTYTCHCGDTYVADKVAALGHDTKRHNAQAPTCTEIGWDAYETCSRCDYTTYVEIPATGHSYSAVVTAPTCTEDGYTTYTCHCGDTYVADRVDATGHTASDWIIDVEATCSYFGNKHTECTICHVILESAVIEQKEHTVVKDAAVEATCTQNGLTEGCHCSVCTEVLVAQEIIPALGHDLEEHSAKTPTCTEIGWNAYETCSRCDHTTYAEIPATGHSYSAVVTAPTCTEEGYTTYTCHCGDTYVADRVDATGHTASDWIIDVEATCSYFGNKHTECTICRVKLESAVIEQKEHTVVKDAAVEATCTQNGLTEGCHCSVCTEVLVAQEIIPALGHDLEEHSAKTPTCTEIGWDAYVTCSRCDYSTYNEIAATGHSYSAVVTAPTCTEEGYTTYTCHCGDTYVADRVDATGHNPAEAVVENNVAPTCTAVGSYDNVVYCSVCDVELSRATITVDSLGHDIVNHVAQAPTCTEIGWNAYETCSRCDHTTYAEIPALGHDKVGHVAQAPTCTEIGWNAYETCSHCDYTTYEEIPATGHSPASAVIENNVAPTCTTAGSYDSVVYCSVCDAELSREAKTVAATEHSYSAVVTAPTCTEEGYTTYTCHCGDTYVADKVAALGHDVVNHNAKAPTCTEIGWNAYETCSRCDYSTYVETGKGDHMVIILPAVEPTEYASGKTEGKMCIECGEILVEQKYILPSSHVHTYTVDSECDICIEWGEFMDRCNTRYGYEYMGTLSNGTALQSMYEDIDAVARVFHADVTFDATTEAAWTGPTRFIVSEIDYAQYGLDSSEASQVFYRYRKDNPLFYWLDIDCHIYGDNIVLWTDEQYNLGTQREEINFTIPAVIDEYQQLMSNGNTIYEKARILHNTIAGRNRYAYDDEGNPEDALWAHNIVGMILEQGGVCEGYAKLYQMMLNYAGIDNIYVEGMSNGGGHAWNLIKIDDGQWYWVDVTWDDVYFLGHEGVNYIYFCKPDGNFPDHDPFPAERGSYELPERASTEYAGPSTLNLCTITFETNGGSEILAISIEEGEMLSLSADPTKEGYAFAGWYLDDSYENRFNSSEAITTDLTLYARWIETGDGTDVETYSIIYMIDGGENSSNNPSEYTSISADIVLATAIKDGFAVEGWYLDEELSMPISVIEKGSEGDLVLYPKWSDYKISLLSDNTCAIAGYAGTETQIVIPSIFCSTKVVSILDRAFRNCSSLTSITIPNKLTTIGESAFSGCDSLTSITIPDSVTSIGEYAFWSCDSLTSVIFGERSQLNTIDQGAFSDCDSLISIVIPDSVTNISKRAFSGCSSLESITIPDGVTSINEEIFRDCGSLASLTIPDSVTSIGNDAFYGCTSLTSIIIPASVTSIGINSFEGCTGLTSITIPDSVTTIFNGPFAYCTSLTSITVSENNLNYKSIDGSLYSKDGTNILQYAMGKTESIFTIPDSVTTIGYEAFNGCSNLTSIVIPDSVTSIGGSAFEDCTSLTSVAIPDSVTLIEYRAFYGCTGLISVTFGENSELTKIGDRAFYSCGNLTTITIPDSVTNIGDSAFSGCGNMTYVTYDNAKYLGDETNPYLVLIGATSNSITSVAINENCRIINAYAFSYCTNLTSITIPASVTSIGERAFGGCSNLTSITIPDSVISIGRDAFNYCTNIVEAIVPTNALSYIPKNNLKTIDITGGTIIGDYALNGGANLTSIVIPDSVTSIGYAAFRNCSSLTSIVIPDSVTNIDECAFWGCSSLTSITIPDAITEIKESVFYNCTGLISITIPDGVTSIDSQAFYGCSGMTSIVIPDSVTTIGSQAFYNCNSLTSITIPANVTSIGSQAFSGCDSIICATYDNAKYLGDETNPYLTLIEAMSTSITSVTINENCKIINDYAFYKCSSLTSITIPEGVTTIGAYAFSGCSSLKSITLPASITRIGESAFRNFDGLTSITIPDSVTDIGAYAFAYCTSLTNITIPDNVTEIGSYAFYNCTSLTSVVISDGLKHISPATFADCSSLKSITIPGSVKLIESIAFRECKMTDIYYTGDMAGWCSMTFMDRPNACNLYIDGMLIEGELVIPDTITEIKGSAFYNCTSLTSVVIPDSITHIGGSAFTDCDNLTSVTFEENSQLQSIGDGAFWGCDSLTNIIIPDSVTSIGSLAFTYSGLTSITIPNSMTSIGEETFYDCTSLTNITIHEGVTFIGYRAFYGCDSLISITIPDGVTTIGEGALYGCSSLTSITLPAVWPLRKIFEGSSVVIPSSLKTIVVSGEGTIPSGFFAGCKYVTEIIVSEGITSIGFGAFAGCNSLTSITLPFVGEKQNDTKHFGYIFGASTYHDNNDHVPSSLKSVTITGGTVINEGAFYGCENITNISIPDSVTDIGEYAFYGCDSLIGSVYDNAKYIGTESNPYWMLLSATSRDISSCDISESCKVIARTAFMHCDNLISVTIPASVERIDEDAFKYCYKLVDVCNDSSLSIATGSSEHGYLGKYAKDVRTSAEESKISIDDNGYILYSSGDELTLIGYCGSATELILPEGITHIYQMAFLGNETILSVTLPNSLVSIGDYAFYGCSNLDSVVIPEGVTSVGHMAFVNCDALTSISFEDADLWYVTSNRGDWIENKCGEEITVNDASTNATYFTSTYNKYYWYKE